MKRVLLTGAGGFIGSHCVEFLLKNTDWQLILFDSFRHKGTFSRLNVARSAIDPTVWNSRVVVLTHDLTAPVDMPLENLIMERRIDNRGVVTEKKLDYIINLASDSAVERSVSDPIHCARNNHELMLNVLEMARRLKPEKLLHCSSDEVYGEAKPGADHKEWDVILPSNVYAASKAAQEALAIAYWRTYDVPVVIGNCMNIIGEMQDPEKFLPRIIQYVAAGKEVPIYADSPQSIGSRVYLYAKNKADALQFILQRLPLATYKDGADRPDRYNICGDVELNNLEMAQLVAEIMGKELKYRLVPSESARRGYDRRYALDGSKLRNLGWKMPYTFRESIEKIIQWTLDNPAWVISKE